MPAPRSVALLLEKNSVRAPLTASHLVSPAVVSISMEPDVSTMKYMSSGSSTAS